MYTVILRNINKGNINIAGGKGANLGELIQNNIPVPDGFVVTTEAYEEFMKYNNIDEKMKNLINTRESYDDNNCEKEYDNIRKAISQGNFPEEIFKHIKNSYENMKDNKRVAVRSSATAEDLSNASFAGQQETYLNVMGFECVLARIKDCFASCFSKRSIEYRLKSGYGEADLKCAVVVQAMIESQCAGVMFTANIINGNKDEFMINSSYGLGEAVVSGIVNPDQYTADSNGNIIEKKLGTKSEMIIYGEKEILKKEVDKSKQSEWSLKDEDIKNLCEIGRRIEKIYNNSMDIEWAKKDDNIYILQARAITTLKKNQALENETEFKDIKLSKIMRKNLAFTLEHTPYVYYPLDYEIAMILGDEKTELFKQMGINTGKTYEIDENGIVTMSKSKVSINKNIIHIMKTIKEFTDKNVNRKNGISLSDSCRKKLLEIEKINIDKKSLLECSEIFDKLEEIQKDISHARFRYFIFPAVIIGKKLDRYLKGKYSQYDMLGNLSYRTWQINEDLGNLAEELNRHIKENSSSEYEKFKTEKIDEFLKKNGHKSDYNCYPFSGKSWNEDRRGFEELLSVTMKNSSKQTGEGKYDEAVGFLKTKFKKKQINMLKDVEYYRECHVYREESQYMWEECYELFRKVLNNCAEKLNMKIKDLWFLKYSELLSICKNESICAYDIQKIEKRKSYRKKAESYWNSLKTLSVVRENKENIFYGVTGNNGVENGRACIVKGKDDFSKLKKGDILVCSCTSPEWTPLFSLASAVVSDTGGALSHAAIVAREYGIPAVLGTGNITSVIKDGDRICVDGTRGRVILLDESL